MNMTKSLRIAWFLIAASAWPAVAAERVYTPPATPPPNTAAVPLPKDDWYAQVQTRFDRYGNKPADIVFDGDSITDHWDFGQGKDVWNERFAGRAANFGISADRTEHVLWRLSKGQVDGVDPKLVVLMIGTNNLGRNTPEQIAEGIKTIIGEYEKRAPHAHILLLAIFPRGKTPDDPNRAKVAAVNKLIAPFDDGKRVSFLDFGAKFLEPDGTISPDMMPDFLHPSPKGYVIWADAIKPFVDKYAPSK